MQLSLTKARCSSCMWSGVPAPVATAEYEVVLSSLMNLVRFSPSLCVLFAGQIDVQSRGAEHAICNLSMAAP